MKNGIKVLCFYDFEVLRELGLNKMVEEILAGERSGLILSINDFLARLSQAGTYEELEDLGIDIQSTFVRVLSYCDGVCHIIVDLDEILSREVDAVLNAEDKLNSLEIENKTIKERIELLSKQVETSHESVVGYMGRAASSWILFDNKAKEPVRFGNGEVIVYADMNEAKYDIQEYDNPNLKIVSELTYLQGDSRVMELEAKVASLELQLRAKEVQLNLCPFCGSDAELIRIDDDMWFIKCNRCAAEMHGELDDVQGDWNARA